VRFPNPNGQSTLAAYTEVAWLAENLLGNANENGGTYDQKLLSYAIWTILVSCPG